MADPGSGSSSSGDRSRPERVPDAPPPSSTPPSRSTPEQSRRRGQLNWVVTVVGVLAVVVLFWLAGRTTASTTELGYSAFMQRVGARQVAAVTIDPEGRVSGRLTDGTAFSSQVPTAAPPTDLVATLTDNGVEVTAEPPSAGWGSLVFTFLPVLLLVGFLLFILFTSNPFERVFPVPAVGMGLNPLLQDPGLAFHPPFLYLGYVGFSMAFSFAVAALIEGRVDPAWARWVRPWTLAAWCFLSVGITLGSWWAYYELGWGGFWFWDPVENASFMPWLAGTALLHSAIVVERRDTLKAWTILLAILTFSLSLMGTFKIGRAHV